jgi:hypothetical protein
MFLIYVTLHVSHLLFIDLTNINSVWQSPLIEANSYSAGQKISRFLRNIQVHHSVHENSPLVSILCQMNALT